MKQLKTLLKIKNILVENDFKYEDRLYKIIDWNRNAVEGDIVIFKQATYSGSWKRPKFAGYNIRLCKVLYEKYRNDLQHQFFLMDLESKKEFSLMGRNLYGNGFARIIGNVKEEQIHRENTIEKNDRGDWTWEKRRELK